MWGSLRVAPTASNSRLLHGTLHVLVNACMLIPPEVLLLVAICALAVRHLCFSTMVCTTISQYGAFYLCSPLPTGSVGTNPCKILPERLAPEAVAFRLAVMTGIARFARDTTAPSARTMSAGSPGFKVRTTGPGAFMNAWICHAPVLSGHLDAGGCTPCCLEAPTCCMLQHCCST